MGTSSIHIKYIRLIYYTAIRFDFQLVSKTFIHFSTLQNRLELGGAYKTPSKTSCGGSQRLRDNSVPCCQATEMARHIGTQEDGTAVNDFHLGQG